MINLLVKLVGWLGTELVSSFHENVGWLGGRGLYALKLRNLKKVDFSQSSIEKLGQVCSNASEFYCLKSLVNHSLTSHLKFSFSVLFRIGHDNIKTDFRHSC